MTPRPSVAPATERVIELLGDAIMAPDADYDWVYTRLVDVLSTNREKWEALFRARDGRVGFTAFLDPTTCPAEQLPALAMWAGAKITPNMSQAARRDTIIQRPATRTGAPDRIAAAVRTTLTGSRQVQVVEVDAHQLTVRTYESQTPDLARTAEVMLAAAPAWVLPTHELLAGQSWGSAQTKYPTWGEAQTAYPTWGDALEDI